KHGAEEAEPQAALLRERSTRLCERHACDQNAARREGDEHAQSTKRPLLDILLDLLAMSIGILRAPRLALTRLRQQQDCADVAREHEPAPHADPDEQHVACKDRKSVE